MHRHLNWVLLPAFALAVACTSAPNCARLDELRADQDRATREHAAVVARLNQSGAAVPAISRAALEHVLTAHREIEAARKAVKTFDDTPDKGGRYRSHRSARNPVREEIADIEFWVKADRRKKPELAAQVDALEGEVARLATDDAAATAKRAELAAARQKLHDAELQARIDRLPELRRQEAELDAIVTPLGDERRVLLDHLEKLIDESQPLPGYTTPIPDLERDLERWRQLETDPSNAEIVKMAEERAACERAMQAAASAHAAEKARIDAAAGPAADAARVEADLDRLDARLAAPEPDMLARAKATAAADPAVSAKRAEVRAASAAERAARLAEWDAFSRTAVATELRAQEARRLAAIRDGLLPLQCAAAVAALTPALDDAISRLAAPAGAELPASFALPLDEN